MISNDTNNLSSLLFMVLIKITRILYFLFETLPAHEPVLLLICFANIQSFDILKRLAFRTDRLKFIVRKGKPNTIPKCELSEQKSLLAPSMRGIVSNSFEDYCYLKQP